MKKSMYKVLVIAGLFSVMGSVQAEDDGMGIGVGARYSTLGIGVELGKSLSDNFGVRLGLNQYSVSDSQTIDDIDYDTDLDLQSTSLLLDWYPMGGSFHLTAGYVNSGNELTAKSDPAGPIDIGDTSYVIAPGTLHLNGQVELGSGPYFGLGWGNVPASGFGFTFEAGIVQMGTPDVSLAVSGSAAGVITQADIDQEVSNMEDDLDEFDTYPVVAIGISYGF